MSQLVERYELAPFVCCAPSRYRCTLVGSWKIRQDAQKLRRRDVLIGFGQLSRLLDRFIK